MIFLEDTENKILLTFDKKMKFNSLNFKKEIINIGLSSKVILDNQLKNFKNNNYIIDN